MKALVYYCRWQGAALRLRGRDASTVWGQLVFPGEDGHEKTQDFHFDLHASRLTLAQEEGEQVLHLDVMGVPLN